MPKQHGRYDSIFDEFVESRLKAARSISARSLAYDLYTVSDLDRSEASFFAEDYCTRKGLIRASSTEPDTPILPLPVCLALVAGILFLIAYAALR